MKSCLASSATVQRWTWANKGICAHTFVLAHLPPPSARLVSSPNRRNGDMASHLLLQGNLWIGHWFDQCEPQLRPNKETSYWESKQSPAFEQRGPFIRDNDTRIPVHQSTLSNMFSLQCCDRQTDTSLFKLSDGTQQTPWLVSYNRKTR